MSEVPRLDPSAAPSRTDRAKSRASIFTEGVRQLIWVNGGGTIALLAFLQAMWKKEPALAGVVLCGIEFMVFGIVAALFIPFTRVLHSRYAENTEFESPTIDSRTWSWWLNNVLAFVSIILFLLACLWLVYGASSILDNRTLS